MKFVIPGCNVKVFGRAVHSLARFGDELYFEPLQEGLSLRTVNSSRSAFACFLLSPLFFKVFQWNSTQNKEAQQDDEQDQHQGFNCRLNMKAVVSVFHSLVGIERSVDRCKIQLDLPACRLVFQLYCKYGIIKTHNLTFQDCESLHAVYSKSQCPNVFRAQAKLLIDSVIHFQMNQEEVTLGVTQTKVFLRNYLEDEVGRATLTRICLSPQEFEHFSTGVDTEVTFCLKELRGVLTFAEASNLSVSINFESAGRPIIFSVEDSILEATFILATLADAIDSQTRTLPSEHNAHSANKRSPSVGASRHPQEILDEEMVSIDTSGMNNSAVEAQNELPTSSTIPAPARVRQSSTDEVTEPNQESEGAPPQKKFRSLFFAAMSKPSGVLGETISGQPVLAEDSGSESD